MENFSGDDTDDLLRPVKQWQARQESKDLSRVTIRGLLSRCEGGWWMGGAPPYGYDLAYHRTDGAFLFTVRYEPNGEKLLLDEHGNITRRLARGESLTLSKRDRCRLILSEPNRVAAVRLIFKLYVEADLGYKAITCWLNEKGVPSPRNRGWSWKHSGTWAMSSVREVIMNPIYTGDMVWNRRRDGRFHSVVAGRAVARSEVGRKRLEANPRKDWIVQRDAHPAIVDRRIFEESECMRKKRTEGQKALGSAKGSAKGLGFMLTGLIKCGRCGHNYQGLRTVKGKRRLDGTKVETLSYACGGYITKGKAVCELSPVPKAELEQLVVETVKEQYAQYLGPDGETLVRKALGEQEGWELDQARTAMKHVRLRLEELDATTRRLLDNLTEANREHVDKRLEELNVEREDLERQLEELGAIETRHASLDRLAHETMTFIHSLEYVFEHGTLDEKRLAFRRCIDRIELTPQCRNVKFRLPEIPLLDGTRGPCMTLARPLDR